MWLKTKTNAPVTFIIGVFCGLMIGYAIFSSSLALAPAKDNEDLASQNNTSTTSISLLQPADQSSFAASLDGQIPGPVVIVKQIEMKEGGWLAVHIDNNDSPGSTILGALYLKAGTYNNVAIPLLKGVTDGLNYWLVAHTDNGDHIFDYQQDLPRYSEKGKIEAIKFSVTAESSRGD